MIPRCLAISLRGRQWLAIALLSASLAGCASTRGLQEGEPFVELVDPPAGVGALYIYRPLSVPTNPSRQILDVPVPVTIGREVVGGLLYNGFVVVHLAPGAHDIAVDEAIFGMRLQRVENGDKPVTVVPLQIDIVAGKSTFLALSAEWETEEVGKFRGGNVFTAVYFPRTKYVGISVTFERVERKPALRALARSKRAE